MGIKPAAAGSPRPGNHAVAQARQPLLPSGNARMLQDLGQSDSDAARGEWVQTGSFWTSIVHSGPKSSAP